MEDERDFFERETSFARDMIGRDPEPEDMAREFAKLDPTRRAFKLDQLNASMSDRDLSVHDAARKLPIVRALRNMHDALRKVGR
jgi:hypothetical protein